MNPQVPTDEYLLLIRGTHWSHGMSPEQLQRVMTDFYAWVDGLEKRGIKRGAQPLMEEGKLVSGARGALVTDGAFAESKEAIAGYFLLAVGSIEKRCSTRKPARSSHTARKSKCGPSRDLCRPMAEVNAASASYATP